MTPDLQQKRRQSLNVETQARVLLERSRCRDCTTLQCRHCHFMDIIEILSRRVLNLEERLAAVENPNR